MPSKAWTSCYIACMKEWGCRTQLPSVNMHQFKGNTFLMLIDLSTYPEATISGKSLESQSVTLHVENWNSTDPLARCFISLSHQVTVKVDQDGARAFN